MNELERHMKKHEPHARWSKQCRYCIKLSGLLSPERKAELLAKLDDDPRVGPASAFIHGKLNP